MSVRAAVATTRDVVVRRGLAKLAAQDLLRWVDPDRDAVEVFLLDLDEPTALADVHAARARWPEALIAGHLGAPDGELWTAAQRAGCDLVANRGAFVARLRAVLADAAGPRRRYPLLPAADLAGRLGLVARVDSGPHGPVAVYRIGGVVYAVADSCPHAGARLSEGPLDGTVVTCPRHGSRFDVRTGERVRGPADGSLVTHQVVIDSGQVAI